jgi:hypothetical protein
LILRFVQMSLHSLNSLKNTMYGNESTVL